MSPHAAGQLLSDTENSNPKMTPIWHRKMKFYRLLKPFAARVEGADCWLRCTRCLWPPPHLLFVSGVAPPSSLPLKCGRAGELTATVGVPGCKPRTAQQKGESVGTPLRWDGFYWTGKIGEGGVKQRKFLNRGTLCSCIIKAPKSCWL